METGMETPAHGFTVLLADDHVMLRQGLKALIEAQAGLSVVAEAGDGLQAVELTARLQPDVVIMDVHMPNLNGMDATQRITALGLRTRVIALSIYPKKRFITEMLKAGARGYILKDCAFDELIQAIREVLQGKLYLSREISETVLQDYVSGLGERQSPAAVLSSREREIVQRLAEGQSSKQIAAELHLSPKTVDVHRHRIMQKLQLNSLADLVKYALSEGLTSI